jgi:hypothetical protein
MTGNFDCERRPIEKAIIRSASAFVRHGDPTEDIGIEAIRSNRTI